MNKPVRKMELIEARNTVLLGDCVEVMRRMRSESVDFILTDPPYLVNYASRDGRSIKNDDRASSDWLPSAYEQMFRVLNPTASA